MKKIILIFSFAVIISSCTVWETSEKIERKPPQNEGTVNPDDWYDQGGNNGTIGS